MLQLSTSRWYLQRLTMGATKGAPYHFCLPLPPQLLWVFWIIESKRQKSPHSSRDLLKSCLLSWAALKASGFPSPWYTGQSNTQSEGRAASRLQGGLVFLGESFLVVEGSGVTVYLSP